MVEINWTIRALDDLEDIAQYISKDSEKYAKITIQKLFNSPDVLSQNPKLGRVVPEFKIETIREIIKGNYRIVYKIISAKSIDILAVHHSARHLSADDL